MLSTIFPISCIGCSKLDEFVCHQCLASELITEQGHRPGFRFKSGFHYDGLLASALGRLKNQNEYGYINTLGQAFKNSVEFDPTLETLVPPSTNAAFRKRGFNPAADIAKKAGFRLSSKLRRVKQNDSQRNLDFRERQLNIQNLFELREPADFLIFDDVVTTGATIREIIRAVDDRGGRVAGVFALCSTAPKGANC